MLKSCLIQNKKFDKRSTSLQKLPTNQGQNDFYDTTQQKKLPKNFAEDLLNLEMEAESQNISIETVTKLLQLYATAIEYYESIQNQRYLIFKNKTQALLLKQNVNNAMNVAQIQMQKQNQKKKEKLLYQNNESYAILKKNQNNNNGNTDIINNNTINNDNLNQRRESLRINMIYLNQQDSQANVQKILQEQNQNFEHSKQIITRDIKEQECQIKKKLQLRKVKKNVNQNDNIDLEDKENIDYYDDKQVIVDQNSNQ